MGFGLGLEAPGDTGGDEKESRSTRLYLPDRTLRASSLLSKATPTFDLHIRTEQPLLNKAVSEACRAVSAALALFLSLLSKRVMFQLYWNTVIATQVEACTHDKIDRSL